ncbi:hypothetical protein M6B38_115630 [Iris pallida]|uniref:Uncharacterized protein n=1 Tax=Iris pallida TaxID=29817 RepID=A0AAX6I5D4_IRIPA|nr:hypothetical protein M6B38_115630 [Iris pallida]
MPTRTRQLRVATSSMAVLHRNLNHDGVADNHRGGRRSHGEAGRPVEEEDEVRWPPCSVVGKRHARTERKMAGSAHRGGEGLDRLVMRTTMKLPLFGGDAVLRIRSLDVGSDGYGSGEVLNDGDGTNSRTRRGDLLDTPDLSVDTAKTRPG